MSQPVAPSERVATLDVLRGLALAGVLIANTFDLFSGRIHGAGADLAPHPLDGAAMHFERLFVAGRAMTLLTLLFGLGFATLLLRAEERGESVTGLYARRLGALLLIGLSHITLLWWGDVTFDYSVMGFALLAFRRVNTRTLLVGGLALIVVPPVVASIPAIQQAWTAFAPHPADRRAFDAEMLAAIRGTDYGAVVWAHLRMIVYFVSPIAIWYVPWLLGRFLLGYAIGKVRLFDRDGADHLPLFRKVLIWGAALGATGIGVALVRLYAMTGVEVPQVTAMAMTAFREIAMLGQVAAYVSAVVLLMQRARWRRVLSLVAPVGRMPLTTYLSQSVFCTFVYYGRGLGLAGEVGPAGLLAISLAIYALQIAIAHLWLRSFRFGPVEWLWRTIAYGKRPRMRECPREPGGSEARGERDGLQ